MSPSVQSYLSALHCPECEAYFATGKVQTYCVECQSPILARYDYQGVKEHTSPKIIRRRSNQGIWRWAELLPVQDPQKRITLGEGNTPLLNLKRIGEAIRLPNLMVKDESPNPTGTFKARGLACAVSKASELGLGEFVLPTAGNAGAALATYAARAGLKAHIYMPQDAPVTNQEEVRISGADLHLVPGSIREAAERASHESEGKAWFSMSTFKEPYRLEGKKTLGFELAEQLNWSLPDVIIYPTGGGTGLVGMWKAFDEMETLGWIGAHRPRMVSVQAAGCAPIVKAFTEHAQRTSTWEKARTIADGLRVPEVFADRLILRILRESHGTAVAVTDGEITEAQSKLGRQEGIFAAPEGAAPLAAAVKLAQDQWLSPRESIILFNTGSGLKYIH